jgi:hypothetical protein
MWSVQLQWKCAAHGSRVVSYCMTIQAAVQRFLLHAIWNFILLSVPLCTWMELYQLLLQKCTHHVLSVSRKESLCALKHALQFVIFAVRHKVHYGNWSRYMLFFPRELLQYGDIPINKIRGLGSQNPFRLFCFQMPHMQPSWTIQQ